MIPDRLESVVRPHLASIISPALKVSGPGPARFLRLVYVQAPSEPPAVTWVAGVAPQSSAGPDEDAVVLSEEDPPWPVQVGLSEDAALAIGLVPGDRLTVEDQFGKDIRVRISGIYSPDDPDDPAWTVARELLSPAVGTSDGVARTSVAALVSSESLPDLRIAVPSDELTEQISFLPDPERVRWEQSSDLQQDVVELEAAPGLASGGVGWDSALDTRARRRVSPGRGRAWTGAGAPGRAARHRDPHARPRRPAAGTPARRPAHPRPRAGGDAGGHRRRAGGGVTAGRGGRRGRRARGHRGPGRVRRLAVGAARRHGDGAGRPGARHHRGGPGHERPSGARQPRRSAYRGATTTDAAPGAGGGGRRVGRRHVRRPAATRPGRGRPRSGQHAHGVGAGRRAPAGPRAAAAGAPGGAR